MPVVYTSEHLSMAVLETLVHVDPEDLPDTLVAYRVALPDGAVRVLEEGEVDPEWAMDPLARASRARGDAWAASAESLALSIPSAILPEERNVLLNPRHPAMSAVRIVSSRPFAFDPRLLR